MKKDKKDLNKIDLFDKEQRQNLLNEYKNKKYDFKNPAQLQEAIDELITLQEKRAEVNIRISEQYKYMSSITLNNFRGFSKEQTIDTKNTTLLYGANSAGKSSVFKSLLLLKQTMEESDNPFNRLISNGKYVKLGNYNEYVNAHDSEKKISIKVDVVDTYISGLMSLANNPNVGKKYIADLNKGIEDEPYYYLLPTFSIEYVFTNEECGLEKINVYTNGEFLFDICYQNAETYDRISKKNYLRYKIENFNLENVYASFFNDIDENYVKEIKCVYYRISNLVPIPINRIDTFTDKPDPVTQKVLTIESTVNKEITDDFNYNILSSIFSVFKKKIESICYLGPLRENPERFYISDNRSFDYVGETGINTSEILYNNKEVLEKTNEWLKKLTNYSIDVSSLSSSSKEVGDQNIYSLRLIDETTKMNVNITDVGFGISQILPIIVQAFTSEKRIILIEEPEIHIHPKLQAELGSMFAEASKNNQFIIETHSENLLLRFKKLIRDGKLDKDNISITYIDKDVSGSYCVPIRLDDNGDFLDVWPDGFFEESFEELF